ncbi:MAG: hypothetical protein K8H88_06975, partial [Sandaracinaceae bacterium]|nr:hypothetical protein [Sandaracinaceae bacterium]
LGQELALAEHAVAAQRDRAEHRARALDDGDDGDAAIGPDVAQGRGAERSMGVLSPLDGEV